MKNQFKLLIASIVFLCLFLHTSAQNGHLQLNNLTTDDGLSSSNILCIQQDQKGFIWIGTYDGVNRFDGKVFRVYKNEPNNKNSLPDNLIRSLYINKNNDLYLGTNTGISKYNPITGGFINFNKDSSSCLYNFIFQAYGIDEDQFGQLWIASNVGLIKFDLKNNQYVLFAHNTLNQNSLSDSQATDVLSDEQGRIWISTRKGFYLYNVETNVFTCIGKGIDGQNFSEYLFWSISEDKNGNIWVNSEDGLFRIEDKGNNDYRLFHYKNNVNDPYSISPNFLSSSYVDSENNLWIGAENNGLYFFDREHQNFRHQKANGTKFDFLKSTSVNAIFQDRSGNLWFGTYGHGVFIEPKNGNSISVFEEMNVDGLTFNNIIVNSFLEDSKGRIWIGTDGKGLFGYDKTNDKFINFRAQNSQISNDYILSMVEDESHNIWLATWDGGLIRFSPENNTFKSFNTRNSEIPDNKIYSISKGSNNDLWLGCHYGGLVHFIPELNEFETINEITNKADNNTVNIVRNNGKGDLYVGTTTGFLIYTPESKKIERFSEIEKKIGIVEINDIVFENDTSVWFGTLMGIDRFNPKTERFEHFSISDGLPGNVISGLVIDDAGMLWASTTSGICMFDRKNGDVTIYTRDDGLQSNEFKARSIQKDRNGNLYFGGVNGFNVIDPKKLVQNTTVPDIQITGLDIYHIPVSPATPGSPLKKTICETNEISLRYDQSVLTFHFASLDFTSPNKNRHAYMLENFDDDWIQCGNSREATYTNLDPGKYIFRVKGSNNSGVWNEEGTSIQITIIPPWWQTLLFRILGVLAIIITIVAVYYYRVSSLKKQKHLLEENVKKRTEELAKINATKDKLFSIIAHDLKNPFNIILGYTDLLIENFENYDKKSLNVILTDLKESGENAYALLENLLNWSRAQRGTIDFLPEKLSVSEFLPSIIAEVNSVAKKKNITIINHADKKNISIYADLNMLLLICRNLLTNAIKFSDQGQEIIVDVIKNEDFIVFSFKDNGIGIEPGKMKSLFEIGENESKTGTGGEKGTGLGLILSKEFVIRHGGNIWVESIPGTGSIFYFSIPTTHRPK
ncbi:MAG: hypothetical protein JW833_07575 [Prolixibacteraceae bacterium]|nr:hypothetical protein [Prolixibacteraceae bacterium]